MEGTKTQQRGIVVEGLCIGTAALGVHTLQNDQNTFELAIEDAWRTWRFTERFPSLLGPLGGNEIWQGVMDSASCDAFSRWHFDFGIHPVLFSDWQAAECYEAHLSTAGVPFDGWVELAAMIVSPMTTIVD